MNLKSAHLFVCKKRVFQVFVAQKGSLIYLFIFDEIALVQREI